MNNFWSRLWKFPEDKICECPEDKSIKYVRLIHKGFIIFLVGAMITAFGLVGMYFL